MWMACFLVLPPDFDNNFTKAKGYLSNVEWMNTVKLQNLVQQKYANQKSNVMCPPVCLGKENHFLPWHAWETIYRLVVVDCARLFSAIWAPMTTM